MKAHVTKIKTLFTLVLVASLMAMAPADSAVKTDFTGEWTLDQSKSNLGEFGAFMAAAKLSVKQAADAITIVRNQTSPMGESVTTDKLTVDGKETTSTGGMEGSVRKATVKLAADGNSFTVSSNTKMNFNGDTFEIAATEVWSLSADGKTLTIDNTSTTPMGANTIKAVYTK